MRKITAIVDDQYLNLLKSDSSSGQYLTNAAPLVDSLCKIAPDEFALTTPNSIHTNHYQYNNGTLEEVAGTPSSNVALIWGVNSGDEAFSKLSIEQQHDAYRGLRDQFEIILNSVESRKYSDKLTTYSLAPDNLKLPESFLFSGWEDISRIVSQNGPKVLKHRYGAEGRGTHLLSTGSLKSVQNNIHDLTDYFLVEFIDVASEIRLILFGDEVVASRQVFDRPHPWEERPKETATFSMYNPDPWLVEASLDLHRRAGLGYSAVDFFQAADGQFYLNEINLTCPGLVSYNYSDGSVVYDVADTFVHYLLRVAG